MTTEERWKEYCDNQGCWYEDMPAVKEAFIAALNIPIDGTLYEKLYSENKRYQDIKNKHNHYMRKWKDRFGYNDGVSFDIVLADLFTMWKNIDKSCETCKFYIRSACRNAHGSLTCKGHDYKYWKLLKE